MKLKSTILDKNCQTISVFTKICSSFTCPPLELKIRYFYLYFCRCLTRFCPRLKPIREETFTFVILISFSHF